MGGGRKTGLPKNNALYQEGKNGEAGTEFPRFNWNFAYL